MNDGNNNGQAAHGARKPPGPVRMAHASTHDARKPPGPIKHLHFYIRQL